jgi:D-threo-aldose 1-dehydrogenase
MPPEAIARRDNLRRVAERFGVDLRTAAMQFSAAPDVVVALIVGAHTADQALANASAMTATLPPAFWEELTHQGLIDADAPLPRVAELV